MSSSIESGIKTFVFLHGLGDNIMFSGPLARWAELSGDVCRLVVMGAEHAELWIGHPAVLQTSILPMQPRYWNPSVCWFDRHVVKNCLRKMGITDYQEITIQLLPEFMYKFLENYGMHKVERMQKELKIDLDRLYKPVINFGSTTKSCPKIIMHRWSRDPRKVIPNEIWNDKSLESFKDFSGTYIVPLVPETSLRELGARLGRECRLAICSDSSVAHVAAAAGVQNVAIYQQPGRPDWYRPLSKNVTLFSSVWTLRALINRLNII